MPEMFDYDRMRGQREKMEKQKDNKSICLFFQCVCLCNDEMRVPLCVHVCACDDAVIQPLGVFVCKCPSAFLSVSLCACIVGFSQA